MSIISSTHAFVVVSETTFYLDRRVLRTIIFSLIYFLSVPHSHCQNDHLIIFYEADQPIIPDPISPKPSIFTQQGFTIRPGIYTIYQMLTDPAGNNLLSILVQFPEFS